MIRVITGLPGHGKTLWAVSELARIRALDDARPLYVCGIRDLAIPHHVLADGRDWQNVPDGSLIVIDEAQGTFPTRGASTPPPHVQATATHRHRGIDIWLITQHPGNIDSFVRERVCEEHIHVVRVMGSESAMVYRWHEVQPDPRSISSREAATATPWPYPKSSFGLYSSAVMHTGKSRVPVRKLALIASVVLVPFVFAAAWAMLPGQKEVNSDDRPLTAQPAKVAQAKEPETPDEWLAQWAPRVPHRPESAPAYDKVVRGAEPPRVFCMDVEFAACRCYTEQATIWSGVDQTMCKTLARVGAYQLRLAKD